ncbi:hypothetical protein H7J07_05500 [Mycobacterium koreense]|uniref:Uncharacterized protein n=1 Tax=Mycolicibacillus koreensis TaxID=1069220 RepID=A0A7I7SAZ3_9MYCO|nr:hypothetical protein [Mycolicibacillus koreensis]MCV7247679.1 hypothetical protein [Mycolicibacillus koreensis]OSC34785.1 hypothetical protein B8W67_05930 [Mycolicibacillus koreensis]BBY54064.1 hypothetical protein MKOR_13150 [Mycolicibacillus koreensis]
MHYTHDDIMDRATDLGDRYRETVLVLEDGDTAESALSTKWCFGGPGTVRYLIHPSGWQVAPDDTISKRNY